MSTKNRFLSGIAVIAVGLLLVAVTSFWLWRKVHVEEYRRFSSPNGDFVLIVYRYPSLVAMPGQGGDASGFVRLSTKSGRVLHEKSVDMVNTVDTPEWTTTNVWVKLFAHWELPQSR